MDTVDKCKTSGARGASDASDEQELLIKAVQSEEKPILQHLMQFYFYDFSEYVYCDVETDGWFGAYPALDSYWEDSGKYPFFIMQNGKYAGFVFVRWVEKLVPESTEQLQQGHYSIAEFFVMKKYRRSGIGRVAAEWVFNQFKGNWEVFQMGNNKPAHQFWVAIINDYTNGNFSERTENGRTIQTFIS
ncbi:GNAT family N-acetyltransferase [Paenibacillus sp. 481]|uniref:GNAT family N-acetyltransferase n=1 Tax=Paenibacillus sp. 481 TaxID=2835869 RepID=UPI001E5BC5E7|nr:GNAT family N-acetyltransferase [Paenibacillus sp. 481]UHA73784.1 GNAT family N-acetyltransferase [Paenibacillus sp. 481]